MTLGGQGRRHACQGTNDMSGPGLVPCSYRWLATYRRTKGKTDLGANRHPADGEWPVNYGSGLPAGFPASPRPNLGRPPDCALVLRRQAVSLPGRGLPLILRSGRLILRSGRRDVTEDASQPRARRLLRAAPAARAEGAASRRAHGKTACAPSARCGSRHRRSDGAQRGRRSRLDSPRRRHSGLPEAGEPLPPDLH